MKTTLSKTQQAIALVDGGMSAYGAAKQLGISDAAVARGLARRKAAKGRICPCCHQVVRAGFEIDKSVLKK